MMDNHPNSEKVVPIGSLLTAFFLNMPFKEHLMLWCLVYTTKRKQSPASILNCFTISNHMVALQVH